MKVLLILILFSACLGSPKQSSTFTVDTSGIIISGYSISGGGSFDTVATSKYKNPILVNGEPVAEGIQGYVIPSKKWEKKGRSNPTPSFGIQPDSSFFGIGGNMIVDTGSATGPATGDMWLIGDSVYLKDSYGIKTWKYDPQNIKIDTSQFDIICAKSISGLHKNCEHDAKGWAEGIDNRVVFKAILDSLAATLDTASILFPSPWVEYDSAVLETCNHIWVQEYTDGGVMRFTTPVVCIKCYKKEDRQ